MHPNGTPMQPNGVPFQAPGGPGAPTYPGGPPIPPGGPPIPPGGAPMPPGGASIPPQYGQPPPGYPNPMTRPAGAWPPPYPPYPPQAVARRPRRRAVRFLVLAIVVALVASITFARSHLHEGISAIGDLGTVATKPAAKPANPRTLAAVLGAQSTALVAGDEAGFLAGIDSSSKTVIAAYQRLYKNMRALHVVRWDQSAPGDTDPITGRAEFDVDVSYCLVVTTCKDMSAVLSVTAEVHDGRAIIVGYSPPASNRRFDEPIPWETANLSAVTGPRVVVAASSAEADELRTALPIAERAAAAADQLAKWGKPPVYLVYLAGASDAKKWFGGGLEHSTGEAIGLSATDIEVMVVLPAAGETRYAGPGTLATVIQHEMGHVATLYGDEEDNGHDSFIEGIAEYTAYNGHSSWATYRLDNTREYIASGKWSGQCYLTKEITSSDVLTGSAAYGIGYLTIKRLVSKYGTAKMLDFWGGVEREKQTPDQAARAVFGVSWKTVNADCASYIRRALHA